MIGIRARQMNQSWLSANPDTWTSSNLLVKPQHPVSQRHADKHWCYLTSHMLRAIGPGSLLSFSQSYPSSMISCAANEPRPPVLYTSLRSALHYHHYRQQSLALSSLAKFCYTHVLFHLKTFHVYSALAAMPRHCDSPLNTTKWCLSSTSPKIWTSLPELL